jgi:hypothetical protein
MTIYITRYQARKNATGSEIVVKVAGGYVIMSAYEYQAWRKQR